MRPDWLELARQPAPRYTSYPTAAQFTDLTIDQGPSDWIRAISADDPISVYVHVPFCEQLCWYCGCHTTIPNGYDRIGRFVSQLLKEIDLWANALPSHAGIDHLHFGGGTPNALNADDMMRVMGAIREKLNLQDRAEISVELDPRTLGPDMISALAASGVTRASLGVQDFNRTVQEAINRVQPFMLVKGAVKSLRAAEIDAINFDLLYGLPHQTTESVANSAKLAASLQPNRISAFGYAHVPWFAKHQKAIDERALPDIEARFDQYQVLAETLISEGYIQIGLDHFARDDDTLAKALATGQLKRNFQGYTTDDCNTLIAMGPSGISAFKEGYAQNAKDIRAYSEMVDKGELALNRGVARTADDHLRSALIERVMCDLYVDVSEVCRRLGRNEADLADIWPRLREAEKRGLCDVDGSKVIVPFSARIFVRSVAQCFDAYLGDGAMPERRHAKAV